MAATLAETMDNGAPPMPGELAALLQDTDVENIMMNALSQEDREILEDEDEDIEEPELDLNEEANTLMGVVQPQNSMAQGVVPSSRSASTQAAQSEDSPGGFSKKQLFLAVGLLLVTVIFVVIYKVSTGSKPEVPAAPTTQPDSTQSPVQSSIARYANDTLAATDLTTYVDSMTITKYIEIDKDACDFVFEGYAENARAFVKAYVTLEEYNTYRTGARVPVLYEQVTVDGKNYFMNVRLNI